ncbi:unnamed protein product [Candida verbasci]|uniref:Uncharacterized protein n=1 Tax=Candida verbasci TaxID=1227364 RepID=A0A9W4TVW7_9ASCO|nr:unnamed protein product [Candida verbasci]
MGYPEQFKIATRLLNDNILLGSTAFTRFDRVNFGARMAIFNYKSTTPSPNTDNLIIWSPLPYGSQVQEILQNFTTSNFESSLKYVIIPDKEHNMAGKTYKEKFPNCKLIGMEGIDYGTIKLDYIFKKSMGNMIFKDANLREIINDDLIVDNFEFVYLPYHSNQELVVYEKKSKTLFEADLLFNLGCSSQLEQFSPATGYPSNFNPHTGWSFLTRYLQPYSKIGRWMFRFVVNVKKSKQGLQAISLLNFDNIVMCHGNIITENAKKAFDNVFID